MLHRSLLIVLSLSMTVAAQTPKSAAKPAPASAPKAIFHTSAGDITCELFPDKAPKTVANFIGLSNGTKGLDQSSRRQDHARRSSV